LQHFFDFRKSTALFEGFQASSDCLSYKSRLEMKINVGHWWNEGEGKPKYLEKNLCCCHADHQHSERRIQRSDPGLRVEWTGD